MSFVGLRTNFSNATMRNAFLVTGCEILNQIVPITKGMTKDQVS